MFVRHVMFYVEDDAILLLDHVGRKLRKKMKVLIKFSLYNCFPNATSANIPGREPKHLVCEIIHVSDVR